MDVIRDINNLITPPEKVTGSLGNFDGVHIGHQYILDEMMRSARSKNGTAAVVTFHPHPLKVLNPGDAPQMVNTLDQRLELLEKLGIALTVVIAFTPEFAEVSPERFIEHYLYEKLAIEEIYVGENFRFGRDAGGDLAMLEEKGEDLGFKVCGIPEVYIGGGKIGSRRLRRMINDGEMSKVRIFLGRRYFIEGRIVKGAGRGRKLGFPTANIEPVNEIIPCNGVYITEIDIQGIRLKSMTYIGDRPTFDAGFAVESFVLGFHENILGRKARLFFYKRIRDDIKFDGAEDLVDQMNRDLETTREFFRVKAKGR